MIFKSSFGEINYEIIGNGSPLLMIHGTPFSSKEWSEITDAVKHKHEIYTYDLLGYGLSEKVEDRLCNIRNKIRILWGENDNWIPLEIGKRLHEILPDSTFRSIPESNHLMQIDKPNEIIKEIEEFFMA